MVQVRFCKALCITGLYSNCSKLTRGGRSDCCHVFCQARGSGSADEEYNFTEPANTHTHDIHSWGRRSSRPSRCRSQTRCDQWQWILSQTALRWRQAMRILTACGCGGRLRRRGRTPACGRAARRECVLCCVCCVLCMPCAVCKGLRMLLRQKDLTSACVTGPHAVSGELQGVPQLLTGYQACLPACTLCHPANEPAVN